jgi:hypothetical protein
LRFHRATYLPVTSVRLVLGPSSRAHRAGGIRKAVRVLRSGIMQACVEHGVDFVLAGSIRNDGPLLGVIADTAKVQRRMGVDAADLRRARQMTYS